MARPTKQGLEYFALDVNMNDEVEIIEAEHGLSGFAILIKLFQKIYLEGYYYRWNEREQILFSNRVGVDRKLLTSIVSDCIKWDIFSKDLYDRHNILTSKRIQEHYFTATYKRVDVEADKNYLMIDISDKNNIKYIGVTDDRNPTSTKDTDDGKEETSGVTDIQSTQSKVKESKGKESRVDSGDQQTFLDILKDVPLYPLDNDKDIELYKTLENQYPSIDIVQAINSWKLYKMDKPLEKNSNARSQINNYIKKSVEYGHNLKPKKKIKYIDENPFLNRS